MMITICGLTTIRMTTKLNGKHYEETLLQPQTHPDLEKNLRNDVSHGDLRNDVSHGDLNGGRGGDDDNDDGSEKTLDATALIGSKMVWPLHKLQY